MAYAITLGVGFILGFILGAIVSRRAYSDISKRAKRVDDDYRQLGDRQGAIGDAISNSKDELAASRAELGRVEQQIDTSRTTISGMGDRIQRARELLADVQTRNTKTTP